MSERRVLVVGTTPDYIKYIHKNYHAQALFLTDEQYRSDLDIDVVDNIITKLDDFDITLADLTNHLKKYSRLISGIACYDCERLSLASELSVYFDLKYPTLNSIRLMRDKYLSKKRWAEYQVDCPGVELVRNGWETIELLKKYSLPLVLKPLTGSGSELTFLCRDRFELTAAYQTIKDGLESRKDNPLYHDTYMRSAHEEHNDLILAEEFIEGREYSADFIISGKEVKLIRIAKKLKEDNLPFGTTTAYVIPAKLPSWLDETALKSKIKMAASALNLDHAVCMVDFIISRDRVVFLEMTSRIGGDCLPYLIKQSCGLDTIKLALDFAESNEINIPPTENWKTVIGLRLFADKSGVLQKIDISELESDPRFKEAYFKFDRGTDISLPPDDYHTWILGHVIFEPIHGQELAGQCREIESKISIEVESYYDRQLAQIDD